ncbi:FAD linked oxidase-like protein [Melanomma pulvis-pyrius CBS 109.77]|uniref:FAD linked oxidase-like protein n=1 Tax=Melanomma pulvis-pyrius CBS 109.77 TaxID=1314802 RepID=A0A6A6WWJ9_9PLEO|nr:FAD linked oxidase-like protein [Melanomma pulvis-pyrius CBS 109.77]
METQIEQFLKELALSTQQLQPILAQLKADSNLAAFLGHKSYDATKLTALACSTLKVILGDNVVDTPPVSQSTVGENWSQACWQTPTCIILAKSPVDVSKTLKIIKFFCTKFAVRSGGHSPNPGWSSISGPGVLIDLQRLNEVTVSTDKKVVSLGPGGRWGDVYQTLDPYGVSVIGGRIPHVGVAGVILGGGFFHFSGEYGLAADNVKNFEIVTAAGAILNANKDENSDLFWALKGGGANYGIVTRFDLYTIPVHDIWYQVGIYATEQVPAILDAFAEWQNTGASDLKSTVALIVGLESTTLGLLYSAPADAPKAFAPFYNIPATVVAVPPTNGTVLSLTQILGSTFSNEPLRHDYRGISSKIDAKLYKDVYAFWREKALAVHAATGANQTFTLQPVTANMAKVGAAKGGNPTGIPSINHQWWTTLVDWNNASDDNTVRSVSIATTEKWREYGQSRGLDLRYIFMNDASRDQNPLQSYGSDNVARLKQIAKKYDPAQTFQNDQNAGFLLSRS